jgi:tellurite resistance protein
MGFLTNILKRSKEELSKYSKDTAFLTAAVAASALVINADGLIEDAEQDAAIAGLTGNAILAANFTGAAIESELSTAINQSKTRAGKQTLKRALESMITRPATMREDIFLIAADVADQGGIGEEETAVLKDIGKILNLDAARLLAA